MKDLGNSPHKSRESKVKLYSRSFRFSGQPMVIQKLIAISVSRPMLLFLQISMLSAEYRYAGHMQKSSIPVVMCFAAFSTGICHAQSHTAEKSFDAYLGVYKLNSTDFISIAKFDLGDGEKRMLFTDF